MKLFKYFFSRAYYFCTNVFGEREFPHWFASGIVSILFVCTLVTVLQLVEYIILPDKIETYEKFQGYLSLAIYFIIVFFVNKNHYYSKILEEYQKFTSTEMRILAVLSWIYVALLFLGFFYLAHLIREY